MPVETPPPLPVQIYILLLFLGGLAAFIHFFFISKTPKRIDPSHSVPGWRLNPADFFAGLFASVLILILLQIGVARLLTIDPETATPAQMIFLGAITHLGALALLFAFYKTYPKKFQEPFTRTNVSWPRSLAFAGCSFLIMLPIIYPGAYLWQIGLEMFGYEPTPQETVELFSQINTLPVALLMIVLTVFIAPVSEEIVFRGCIYRFLKDKIGIIGALAVSGLLFAMLHQSFSTLLPLFLLGVALAYSYEKTGNLKVPILFHAFFNANTVLVILLTEPL